MNNTLTMRNTILILAFGLLISCTEQKDYLTNGEWSLESYVVRNETQDTFKHAQKLTYWEDGRVYENDYKLIGKYQVDGKYLLLNDYETDSAISKTEILSNKPSKIILGSENLLQLEKNNEFTYGKGILTKLGEIKESKYDFLLRALGEFYELGKVDTLGDGTICFGFEAYSYDKNYSKIYEEPNKADKRVKNTINNTLNTNPIKTDEGNRNWEYFYVKSYEWETMDLNIKLDNRYKKKSDQDILQPQIWITIK